MSKRSRSEFDSEWKSYGVSEGTIGRFDSKNITKMLEIQAMTQQSLMDGKSIIGRALTGSGKTQAFLVPIVEKFKNGVQKSSRNPKVLILNPTRELVTQTYKNAELLCDKSEQDDFSLKVLKLQGGTDWRQNQQDLNRGADLVISTPGRTIDLIDRGYLNLSEVECLIMDEADRMLDMGFKDDIYKIMSAVKNQNTLQFCLISATVNDYFFKVCKEFNIEYEMIDLVTGRESTPKKIKHLKMKCPHHNLHETIADVITVQAGVQNKTIVFVPKKHQINEILNTNKIKGDVGVIHGDIPQKQREVAMNLFRQGKVMVLLTTDVCARGIDLPDLDLVIQVEPPGDVESQVHRSGRTGRNGRTGTCVTFQTSNNKQLLDKIERVTRAPMENCGPIQSTDIMAASCRDATHNLDQVQNHLNEEIMDHFKDQSDEIIEKQHDQRKLVASLLCIVGGVDNSLNLSSKSFISGQSKYKSYALELPNETIQSKTFLFKILNTAMDTYNKTTFEDKEIFSVNISRDQKTFYFDISEDRLEHFKELFNEDGTIKYGFGKKLGVILTEITSTDQLDYVEQGRGDSRGGRGGFSRNGGDRFERNGNSRGGRDRSEGGFRGNNFDRMGSNGRDQSNGRSNGDRRNGGDSNGESKTVFVNGLDDSSNEREVLGQLRNLDLTYSNHRVPCDRSTEKLKGFMFLEFDNTADALRATDIINSKKKSLKWFARISQDRN